MPRMTSQANRSPQSEVNRRGRPAHQPDLCLVDSASGPTQLRDSRLDTVTSNAGSNSGTRISRRWIAALVLLLIINVSLVAWAMSIPAGPSPASPTVAAANSGVTESASAPVKTSDRATPPAAPTNQPTTSPPAPPVVVPPPAAPIEPPAAELQPALTIVNPRQTGGAVHYAVEGEVFSLQAGEYHQLPGDLPRKIEFDRGDDYGYAELRASEGTFAFDVGSNGWALNQVDRQRAKLLIEACQPIVSRP
jgi:hypothetical protein